LYKTFENIMNEEIKLDYKNSFINHFDSIIIGCLDKDGKKRITLDDLL